MLTVSFVQITEKSLAARKLHSVFVFIRPPDGDGLCSLKCQIPKLKTHKFLMSRPLAFVLQPSIKEGPEPFYFHGSSYLWLHVVFGPILQSERRGRLDFGGEDLPEPPLQLLHVGRFGSGQVETSSSFLPVPSSQRPNHLEHRKLSE